MTAGSGIEPPGDEALFRHSLARRVWDSFLVRVLVLAALLACLAVVDASTYDEPKHFAAGLYDWNFGEHDLYYVNPPMARMVATLPSWFRFDVAPFADFIRDDTVTMWDGGTGAWLWSRDGARAEFWLAIGRIMLIPFAIFGLWATERFTLEIYGARARPLAGWLYVGCPNLLAGGHSIAADGVCAAMVVASCWLIHRWLVAPSLGRCASAGVVLGLALATKTVAVMLLPLMFVVWIIARLRAHGVSGMARPKVYQLLAVGYLAFMVLNTIFGWVGTGGSLDSFEFVSKTLAGPRAIESRPVDVRPRLRPSGNRFRGTLLGKIPVPLPAYYVYGIDRQKSDFETSEFPTFLSGHWRRGQWSDPLRIALIKLPLGVLGMAALAVILGLLRGPRLPASTLLVATLLLLVGLNLSQSKMTIFFRYMLPSLPLFYILLGGLLAPESLAWSRPLLRRMTGVLLALALLETAWSFPHVIAFGNVTAGGTWNAHRHFLGANESGQNLWRLQRWADRLPQGETLVLSDAYRLRLKDVTGRDTLQLPTLSELRENHRRQPDAIPLPEGWYVSAPYDRHPPDSATAASYLDAHPPIAFIAPGLAVHYLSTLDIAELIRRVCQDHD